MKNFKLLAVAISCAGAALLCAATARAQITGDSSAAAIVVKQKPIKAQWLKAEVIHADQNTIMVREADNQMKIHTFTYADKARDKISKVLDQGGYQTGDIVKIRSMPGGTEALDIKGKPSKAI
ncbi:MAG: hypothetical protein WCA38_01315 [Candidatus Acidiferrales bacterium]